jgi:hypothetical protein
MGHIWVVEYKLRKSNAWKIGGRCDKRRKVVVSAMNDVKKYYSKYDYRIVKYIPKGEK